MDNCPLFVSIAIAGAIYKNIKRTLNNQLHIQVYLHLTDKALNTIHINAIKHLQHNILTKRRIENKQTNITNITLNPSIKHLAQL